MAESRQVVPFPFSGKPTSVRSRMGLLKFRLPSWFEGEAELRKAYVTGQDRTPQRAQIDFRSDLMLLYRDSPESGRLHVPWHVEGFGTPIVATATLAERAEPYHLSVELARGKLNDVRNQVSDWQQAGLKLTDELRSQLDGARTSFARAATSGDQPEEAFAAAQATLKHAFSAGQLLVEEYTDQVLRRRLEHSSKLPTLLGCGLEGLPKTRAWSTRFPEAFNAASVDCSWAKIAPDEGQHRWDLPDAQIHWCRRRRLTPMAGPLIDFRPGALPNWLWLWQGDYDEILAQAIDHVRQAVGRYRGKVGLWHLVHRPASHEILGLNEEEQIRMTARLVQVARQVDPHAQLVVDFDRPWGEWMASAAFQLGPLHLADSLARADLGLTGIGLEIAPGYGPEYGSHLRDLFDFSRLLDLFALVNLPLYLSLALPSAVGKDANLSEPETVEPAQWPRAPDEELQKEWARQWVSLAVAKPFVRSVTWHQITDAAPRVFPHSGLFRTDQTPKPAFEWMREFRGKYLR